MTNPKGKRRGTRYMFARPFRKHGRNTYYEILYRMLNALFIIFPLLVK